MIQPPLPFKWSVIAHARALTRFCVEEVAEACMGRELDQRSLVLHLTRGILSDCIIRGQISTPMVERWVMEALCRWRSIHQDEDLRS